MIITGGENVYSIEVERVLAEHPAVAEVAVIGVPDAKWGEAVKAIVSLEGEASEADLIAWARERLAAYKCPKTVDIMDALPRNPTGKILKKDLRKPHWEGRDRARFTECHQAGLSIAGQSPSRSSRPSCSSRMVSGGSSTMQA